MIDKSIQSAGAAGVWRADAVKLPCVSFSPRRRRRYCRHRRATSLTRRVRSYMNIFISTWVLLVAGLIFALPMIVMRVKDHTELVDEAVYVHSSSYRRRRFRLAGC